MARLRIAFVLSLSLLVTAFVLSQITYFFVPFGMMDYNIDGDVFTDVGPYAAQGGLRNGDRISAQTRFFDRLWIVGGAFIHPVAERKTVTVLRNGAPHTVVLSPDPSSSLTQSPDGKLQIILRDTAALAFVLVGTFLVLVRPRPLTWAFYLFTLGPTMPSFLVISILLNLPMPAGFILNLVRMTLLVAGSFGFAAFVLLFPGDRALGWRRAVLVAFLAYLGLMYIDQFVGWFLGGTAIMSSDSRIAAAAQGPVLARILVVENAILLHSDYVMWLGPLLIGIISLLGRYRGAGPQERQRLRWAIAGILLANGALTLQVIALLNWNPAITPPLVMVLRVGAIAAPFIIGYAIFKHRVIDVRFAVSRVTVFIAITAVLVGVFFSIDAVFTTFFANSRLQVAVSLAVVGATALFLGRVHSQIVAAVDGALFPRRRDALDRLKKIGERIEEESDLAAIERLLNVDVCNALGLASAALFVSSCDGGFVRNASVGWDRGTTWHALRDDPIVSVVGNGAGTAVRLEETDWPDAAIPQGVARPAVVIALRCRRRTCALQFYGAHLSGADLDPTEIGTLKQMCSGVAPVFANAP